MRLKLTILVLTSFITITSIIAWSYFTCKSVVESEFKASPRLTNKKMQFHGAKPFLVPIGDDKVRLGWSFYYTPEDESSDVYVYLSLTGKVYFDNCSLIKKPKR